MNAIELLKKPLFQAALIGAFGGIAPKLIEIIPDLFKNVYPSAGTYLALSILAFIGGVIIVVYKEENFQKALILGAGAPALIAALSTQAAAPKTAGFVFPVSFSIVSTAYAQEQSRLDTARFVVQQNESSYKLNALWIRADSTTIYDYKKTGDTIIVTYPTTAKELTIDLPSQGNSISYPVSGLTNSKTELLKILNDQETKDFWKTFGGKSVPKYKLEKVK
ncbi:MAG: hypothetical protein WCT99_07080 [Bacteroidota bacterium]|jgi:hypothetical protein